MFFLLLFYLITFEKFKRYNIIIKDEQQPLIVVKGNKRSFKKENQKMIFLIPELCCLTGISDNMRQDFSLMKEINSYTHVEPNQRYEQLNKFLNDIQKRDEGLNELNKWQINIDKEFLQLNARTIESESIIYKDVLNYFFLI